MTEEKNVPELGFPQDLEELTDVSMFFAALSERLDGKKLEEQDLTRLARSLRLPIPQALKDATIKSVNKGEEMGGADVTTIVVTLPSAPLDKDSIQKLTVQKCYTVCREVKGATVCAQVCITVEVGADGIHGSVTATISAHF